MSYPRLREACQTDVDGTSISTLGELAIDLGLNAEEVMVPKDAVFGRTRSQVPCIAVVEIAGGLTHFVVAWRVHGQWVQLMDPASGRTWTTKQRFEQSLYEHTMSVPTQDWRAHAGSPEFIDELESRLLALGTGPEAVTGLLDDAQSDPSWHGLADLDAGARLIDALQRDGSATKPSQSRDTLLAALASDAIPRGFYQVNPDPDDGDALLLKGAVLVRIADDEPAASDLPESDSTSAGTAAGDDMATHAAKLAMVTADARTWRNRFDRFVEPLVSRRDRALLATAAIATGVMTFLEALVFRYLLDLSVPTDVSGFMVVAMLVLTPLLVALLVDAAGLQLGRRAGRHIDVGLRSQLLAKIPTIADSYFASRLVSDLAERGHALTQLRTLPLTLRALLAGVVRSMCMLGGLGWLLPAQLPWVVALGVIALAVPFATFSLLSERDLRIRTHIGALSRFYLDALRAVETLWAHRAAGAMWVQYEALLVRWWHSVTDFLRAALTLDLVQTLATFAIAIVLIKAAVETSMTPGTMLLVAYWALLVPLNGRKLLRLLRIVPQQKNIAARVVEVLESDAEYDEPSPTAAEPPGPRSGTTPGGGLEVIFDRVSVVLADTPVLRDINLQLAAGEHVAIVGPSGSGKSTLIGTLLGWYPTHGGELRISGEPATAATLAALREKTVWIDPELYLWNRSVLDNLRYGSETDADLSAALEAAEMTNDLQKMPAGLATRVGENGSRLSGGEAQRLRIARGLLTQGCDPMQGRDLVLLDEALRGMDSHQRTRLIDVLRTRFRQQTLLCVCHDIESTQTFDRVVVMQDGAIIEDAPPSVLSADTTSAYSDLLRAEQSLITRIRTKSTFRQLVLDHARLEET